MSIPLGAVRRPVAEQLASHVERFTRHDGVGGIGVAEIVQPDFGGQTSQVLIRLPGVID